MMTPQEQMIQDLMQHGYTYEEAIAIVSKMLWED